MSSLSQIRGATQQSFNDSKGPSPSRIPGTILPPIVAPPDTVGGRDAPYSATSTGRPSLSRTSSISSEKDLPRVHHILNPAAVNEKTSAPPTPDNASNARPFPLHGFNRAPSNERLTPSGSPHGPPHLRIGVPTLSKPTGTIDVTKSPFVPMTSGGPPVPGMTSGPGVAPVLGPRPVNNSSHVSVWRGGDVGNAQSRTGSPASSSYSSYGQPSIQGSPRSEYSSMGQQPPHPQYPPQQVQHQPPPHHAGVPHQPSPQYAPPSPHPAHYTANQQPQAAMHQTSMLASGQYQVITLETAQGPIQVPVDMQAASKVADEKRKRNAGASARFRQRRKEKEREAAQTISKLESQVRELEGDREFYRMERDYFRDVVYKHEPAKASLVPRATSPGALSERKRQSSLTSSREDSAASPNSAGGMDYRETGDRGSDDGRILRRRISAYERDHQAHQQSHASPPGNSGASGQSHHPQQQQHPHYYGQREQSPPQHHGNRASAPPHPISVQQANAQYSLPTPDSRTGTPGSAPMQPVGIPPPMRMGHYDSTGRGSQPMVLETGWAAPS